MNSGSNTAGEQAAAIAFTRKSLLGAGLATAASFVAAPGGLAGTNRDTATAKRLAKLRKAREQLVIEHGRTENDGQLDKTMRTFSRAHEELIPLGSVIDGEKAVKDYYDGSWTVFPDQRNDSDSILRHADCAVIAEESGSHCAAPSIARRCGARRGRRRSRSRTPTRSRSRRSYPRPTRRRS
jgi:hypothetical protein